MQRIPVDEVVFFSSASPVHNARLFKWEGNLYRTAQPSASSFYHRLFRDGIIQRLVEKGLLVKTELTPLSLDGYGVVVRHRRVPFVSYAFEWAAPMLKDAALLMIDLNLELVRFGLTTKDAHPWNILFDRSKPVFIDLASIVPIDVDSSWRAYDEFCSYFLYPLYLMSAGQKRIARWLLHDVIEGISRDEFLFLYHGKSKKQWIKRFKTKMTPWIPYLLKPILKAMIRVVRQSFKLYPTCQHESRIRFLKKLRVEVQNIAFPLMKTQWSDYYEHLLPFSPSQEWTAKQYSVFQVLKSLHSASVLDIGSNRGWYSQLAARQGSIVVAFDKDESCIESLYYDAKTHDLSILPLIMNIRNPSSGYGLCNTRYKPATGRLKSEMVLALALVHHLVFKEMMDFDQIAEALSAFAEKWLLVEFVSREDRYVREWWTEKFAWYTVENFTESLREHFSSVEFLPSSSEPRVLLLCSKHSPRG